MSTLLSAETEPTRQRDESSPWRFAAGSRLMLLDGLRGAASFYVFLHHYVRHGMDRAGGLPKFFVFGQAAVMLFFLLSGFVIHYATFGRDSHLSFRSYFIRRFRRVFPIFAFALLAAYLAACVVARKWVDPQLTELCLNLLQLQDRFRSEGHWALPYMRNWPLWSLAYEWWFYMLYFPVQRLLQHAPQRQQHLAFVISLVGVATNLAWPNPLSHVASYFSLWWFGVELARSYLLDGKICFSRLRFSMLALVALTLLMAALTLGRASSEGLDWYRHPAITLRHFATTLGIIGVGWLWYRTGARGFVGRLSHGLLRPFGLVAPFSYALYVLHLPLIAAFSHVGLRGAGALPLVMAGTFFCSWLLEGPGQTCINRWLRA